MDLRIFTEPQQGATYDDLLRVARCAEECRYDGFFRSDHFLAMGDSTGLPGPTDAWVTLGALARETSTIRLGTLMTSVTFRLPGPLGVAVSQADQMSGGRIELGIGTGWYEAEHHAYGVPFPPTGVRFDMLAEQLEILTGAWGTPVGQAFDFHGEHYTFAGSPGLPKPLQDPYPPVIVGGSGPRRTPALAARFADEVNVPFASVAQVAAQFGRVREACAGIGRDPSTLRYSTTQVLCAGSTETDVVRRAAAIGREPDELRAHGIAGTADEVARRLEEFAAVGVQRVYLQVLDLSDLDHLRFLAQARGL
ncbi:LLM class F420-dependent oxidoreductase [Actinomycetospora termitidis]|uniref:LLM class F420-dependent oxidoreductase n=1 Tax=Actinomycetospora termitidis TaxID=3053470 RepID=A0ABT7MAE7_9PSEU|nr:LLM class F420-dependent oxidoreductase [Actinomycetospora sp. Odt1-22]MDL5156812.1 LLM class F420-dependent oxidoreductase [Actinomycetospora sp. Odt1-22]